jgi:hypothetical protein
MTAFSCAPRESEASGVGRRVEGAVFASGGIEIREASGAEDGGIRLACGFQTAAMFDQPR